MIFYKLYNKKFNKNIIINKIKNLNQYIKTSN